MAGHRKASGRPSPWDERAFGHGSPWDWLVARNARYLLMGVEFNVCSIFHYCQALWVETRHDQRNQGLTWPNFDFRQMGDRLKEAGLIQKTSVGLSRWQAFRAERGVQLVMDIVRSEPGLIQEERLRPFRN